MIIVAFAFAVVFLLRDVQVLAIPVRKTIAVRIGVYTLLLLSGIAIFTSVTGGRPAWTGRRFALGAIAIQLSQLLISLVLQRFRAARYGWIGCILPSPAFLMALSALAFKIQTRPSDVDVFAAIEIVTLIWLVIVGGLTAVLCSLDTGQEEREFATDFAMMTTCTAVIFLPFCFP